MAVGLVGLRCYISRVENGHTVPAVETLEKFARALEVPMYQLLFYDGEAPPRPPNLLKRRSANDNEWGSSGKEARLLAKFRHLLSHMEEGDRGLVLSMAQKMTRSKANRQERLAYSASLLVEFRPSSRGELRNPGTEVALGGGELGAVQGVTHVLY